MRILFVDDDPRNRKLLKSQLDHATTDFLEASDGQEALAILEREHADVVITDILMPRMDGYRLCYEIRVREPLKEIPLIMYSSTYTSPEDVKAALNVGADYFMPKPSSREQLIEAIHHVTTAPRRRAPAAPSPDELQVFKDYSEALVLKLEEKNEELYHQSGEIRRLNENLEKIVADRTRELVGANEDLEAFSYSVSHDLRAPLRSIDGFSQMILEDCAGKLSDASQQDLKRVRKAAQHMGKLIDDMLSLSRVAHKTLSHRSVDLSALAHNIVQDIQCREPQRIAHITIMENMKTQGDPGLLKILLENLIGNAWKFTSQKDPAQISVAALSDQGGQTTFCVKDNGAGFDMAYANKLFKAFQRLHSVAEFPGTGIGLATVQRVVRRHGGRVWADGKVQSGAAFYFSLPH